MWALCIRLIDMIELHKQLVSSTYVYRPDLWSCLVYWVMSVPLILYGGAFMLSLYEPYSRISVMCNIVIVFIQTESFNLNGCNLQGNFLMKLFFFEKLLWISSFDTNPFRLTQQPNQSVEYHNFSISLCKDDFRFIAIEGSLQKNRFISL